MREAGPVKRVAGIAMAALLLSARAAAGAEAAPPKTPVAKPPVATASAAATTPTAAAVVATAAAPAAGGPAEAAPAVTTPAAAPLASPPSAALPPATTSQRQAGVLRDPAPRPPTDVRVQSRFAVKAKSAQISAAPSTCRAATSTTAPARGSAHVLPGGGVRPRAAGFALLELAQRRGRADQGHGGLLPDSHAPSWLLLAGGRYSIGYGKLMIGGLGGAIHFEPQAFLHAGMHAHDGEVGPSFDGGLGLLVFLTPRAFARIDAAVVLEREDRSGVTVSVWGTLPSISVGARL